MPFIRVTGLPGKVYVPRAGQGSHKHRCPDCFECQHCAEERCRVCKAQDQVTPGRPKCRCRPTGGKAGKSDRN